MKRIVIKSIIGLVIAAVVLAFLNQVDYDGLIDKMFNKNEPPVYKYSFFPADYETDILQDPEYLSLNRKINYEKGAVTIADADLTLYPGTAIIKDYLDCMINGDAEGYNKLFSDDYYSSGEKKPIAKFPMQRLYNITVSQVYDPHVFTQDEHGGLYTGITRYFFALDYYIQYNTGTVRNDIPSDHSRTIYIEVFESRSGVQKINNIYVERFQIQGE